MQNPIKGLIRRLLNYMQLRSRLKLHNRIRKDVDAIVLKSLPLTCATYIDDSSILKSNAEALRATTVRGIKVPKSTMLAHSAVMEELVKQISQAVCEDLMVLLRHKCPSTWADTITLGNLVRLQARLQLSCSDIASGTSNHVADALFAALTDDRIGYGLALSEVSRHLMLNATPGVYATFYGTAIFQSHKDSIPNLSAFIRRANAQRTSGVPDA